MYAIRSYYGEADLLPEQDVLDLAEAERLDVMDDSAYTPPRRFLVDVGQTLEEEKPASRNALVDKLKAVGFSSNPPRQLPELLSEAAEIRQRNNFV